MPTVKIASKIRELRKIHGMSQFELSIQADLSQLAIRGYERGTRKPDDTELAKIAAVFGMRAVDLYGRGETEVVTITRDKANELLDSPGETYEPRGLFVVCDVIGGKKVYTAIQNLDGTAETEEFTTERAAERWLQGHSVDPKWIYKGTPEKLKCLEEVGKCSN